MSRLALGVASIVFVVLQATESCFFTVRQTETALITQFGQPVRVITEAGLHTKIPLVQTAIDFDRRLLDYESPGEEVILSDQRRLIVDTFTRYRITDPLQYYQAVGPTEAGIRARLSSVVASSLRRVIGNETLPDVLSTQRGRIMGLIRDQVDHEMRGFGVAIVDVRIRRADLPQENTDAILARMRSERERVATEARAEGAEAAQRIRANADRDKTVLLANARAGADQLRGQGEQSAIAIYADAYGRDPGFYATWRTLDAYRQAFAGGRNHLVLTQDSDFLKLLRAAPAP